MDLTCPRCLTRNHPAATKCYQCQVPLEQAQQLVLTPPVAQWAVPEHPPAAAPSPGSGAVAEAEPALDIEPTRTAQVVAPAPATTARAFAPEPQPQPVAVQPEPSLDDEPVGVAAAPPGRTALISVAEAPTGPRLRTSLADQPGCTARLPLPPIAAPVGYDAATPFASGTAVFVPRPTSRSGNGWGVRVSPRAQAIAAAQERPLHAAASPATAAGQTATPAAWSGYEAAAYQPARQAADPGSQPACAPAYPPGHPPELSYESWDTRGHRLPGGVGRNAAVRIALLLIIALVGIGYLGHRYLIKGGSSTHTISLPASIAGQAQLKGNASLDAISAQFNKTMSANKAVKQALAGVYAPSISANDGYVLMLLVVANNAVAPNDVFNNFQVSNPGIGVNTGATVTKTIDGTDYQCVPATNSNTGVGAVACVWQDHDVVGMLVALNAANPEVIAATAAQAAQTAEHPTG